MSVAIRRTTVTPTAGGNVVQLHISDKMPDDESAKIVLQLSVSLPEYEPEILLAQWQREAVKEAQGVLSGVLQQLAVAIQDRGFPLEAPRRPVGA